MILDFLRTFLRKHPQLAQDYDTFDMRRMTLWGYNAFWWPQDQREHACIFGPTPRQGDLLIDRRGDKFVITEVRTPQDPGDQHFVTVAAYDGPIPGSVAVGPPSWTDGLIQ